MKRLFLLLALCAAGCVQQPASNTANNNQQGSGDQAFKAIHDRYVVEFLKRNPTVNTYLGGAGLDPSLREMDGLLRDYSPQALEAEDRWLMDTQKAFEGVDPNTLSPARRVDREVALAQVRFQLHLHGQRRYQERSLDSYTDEPFRAIDWQLQGMTQTGENTYGTPEEWALVAHRLGEIPHYLENAQMQLQNGVKSGNTPDQRMLRRNGLDATEANAKYFAATLPGLAAQRIAQGAQHDDLVNKVSTASKTAAESYGNFHDFIMKTFFTGTSSEPQINQQFSQDRYALGEEEYNWALKNNLHYDRTAAQLFDESWAIVQDTRAQMVRLAREIGQKRNLNLPAEDDAAVRAVLDELSKEYPKSDDEMIQWYRDTATRLVDYGRKSGLFDVPADYKLDVVVTPPPLESSVDGAAYYPAPPFKTSGVGRFYVTPTHNDPAQLKANNRASLADLAAHEGFPGHDWHYKVMTQFRNDISGVRWLTPGEVEGSSSMWEDSMAAEGWALYSEGLMAEPAPNAPQGFYTPEEHLYQLQGKLYRDLRVRVDTGLHTGRLSYADAVDLFSKTVDFLPGSCGDAAALQGNDAKRASCKTADSAIFRYSKWPTQAITYRLGRDQILDMRNEAARVMGNNFSLKTFHNLFMKQGTIPSGYFRENLLREIQGAR
ncbi:MAG TPA: DUF885 domain-containing protein [Pyrinomonadaceae bacterium]|nr:DUF885 domain-containing protein [Pyrinomonadaceae bacterium]